MALADLPGDTNLSYRLREEPYNENSDVVFVITLDLQAANSNGTSIGWDITEIRFTQILPDDTKVRWRENSPTVPTPDGSWWVEHADPMNPRPGEFNAPPLLEGTAIALVNGNPNLKYSFQGGTCDSFCQQMYNGKVAALTHTFTKVGEAQPLEEGDDEPVETGDLGGDPD